MKNRPQQLALILILIGGCKSTEPSCDPTGPCGPPVTATTYSLMLQAPAEVGAVMLEINSTGKSRLQLSKNGYAARFSASADSSLWKVLILGRPSSARIGSLSVTATGAQAPTVRVIAVAADSLGGYQTMLPSDVTTSAPLEP
jgi:hypothetical protein